MSGPISSRSRFATAYARLREAEGRGSGGERELLSLPYLTEGPMASQWVIRSRTYDAFVKRVVTPMARQSSSPLRILDLGAGNGWLSYRMTQLGHSALAVDFRTDEVDGLGAATPYHHHLGLMFGRLCASFDALPVRRRLFDIALFNASLHYAEDLSRVLSEVLRVVVPQGRIAILDSPFYGRPETGEAMVNEKRLATHRRFAELAEDLLALRSIEYLTPASLAAAADPLGLHFVRHRVWYPFRYEWRFAEAFLKRKRAPSRFDLWEAVAP